MSDLELKAFVPVILEGELHPVVVHVKSVLEVNSSAKLEFTSDGDSFEWMIQQIAERVIPLVECAGQLPIRVFDIRHRETDGGSEAIAPGVIKEGHNT